MMALWLALEVSLLFICNGLTIIDASYPESTTESRESSNEKNDDVGESHHRILHNHMINTLDEIDRDELNAQLSILSREQKEHNDERLEKLHKIVKSLQVKIIASFTNRHIILRKNTQTTIPLTDTEHIHSLLQTIVNNTLRLNGIKNHNASSALEELEILRDYLHGEDNAVDFGKMGGLAIMLQLVLDYPFIEVRTSAAWTIGIACQNNPSLMQIAHNISTVQNILYVLKLSSNNNDATQYPKINLMDVDNINHLRKLIWTLSALTRQNEESYQIFKSNDGSDTMYDWLMETYNFWNSNKGHPDLLSDAYKDKVVEKILMFASDVVVLSPEQMLFVDEKWCDVFAAHFNYAQQHYSLREITLAYWDMAIHKLFCVNCIPFGGSTQNIENDHLSIDIGLEKLMKMEIEDEDEFDLEMKRKAKQLMKKIKTTHLSTND